MSVTSSLRGFAGLAGRLPGNRRVDLRAHRRRRGDRRRESGPAGVFSMSLTRADIAGHITRSNPLTFFIMSASVAPVDSTVMDNGLMPAL